LVYCSTVRLYSRTAYDWTERLAAIAASAERIKAKSFTIDGEAVVLGPDSLSRFEALSRREAARTAILYAFDLIEHDGEDLRNLPFLDRKAALARSGPTRRGERERPILRLSAATKSNTPDKKRPANLVRMPGPRNGRQAPLYP
jgi:ATP-dependent DNA ligase